MKKNEDSSVFDFILITVLVILAGFIAFLKIDNSVYKIRDERSLEDFSKSWHTDTDEEISLEDIGTKATMNENGELEIKVHHTIPAYLVSDTTLNFRSKNIRFKANIGDEIIYSFMPERHPVLSKGNGTSFHRIQIRRENAGQEIVLRIFPAYDDSGSHINNIYLGRTWDYFGKILDKNFFSFQFSIMVAIIGIMLIIMSFLSKLHSGHNERNRVLGILTVCIGLWAASETFLPQFMFGYSFQLNELNHLLLIFLPYFFISYMYQEFKCKRDMLLKIAFVITVLELVVIAVLSVTGIMDSHESLFIVHISFALIVGIAAALIIGNILYCKKNKLKYNMIKILLFLGIFMISAIWDTLSYYIDYDGRDNGSIIRFGILVGILVLDIDSMRRLFEGIKSAEITTKVSEITYTDSLTGIANRVALGIKEKEIQEKLDRDEVKELLICRFNVNDLRKINDNYGHAYGDRHIIKCAEIINKAFGNVGYAFRVDGDEFTVFIIGDGTEYIYERGILKLKELEREYNRTTDLLIPLHIAYGYAVYDKEEFESLEKAEIEADKKMYECKDRMKKGAIV